MQSRNGLTRTDTVVLLGIVGTVCGLLLPACGRTIRSSTAPQTRNNLMQVAFAHLNYHDQYKKLPPAEGGSVTIDGTTHARSTTCIFIVGPYMEFNANALINPADSSFHSTQSPWVADKCYTSIAVNLFVFSDRDKGIVGTNMPVALSEIRDGASNTVMLATTMALCGDRDICIRHSEIKPFFGAEQAGGWQVAPRPNRCQAYTGSLAVSYNTTFLQVALCDSSVRALTSPAIWAKALTPGAGDSFNWE